MKIQIKAKFGNTILFEGEYESTTACLVDAVSKKADLSRADLSRADLRRADLRGACLSWADLRGAYLGGAYLGGAYLGGTKEKPEMVIKENGIIQVGMIGSRKDFLISFDTEDRGIIIRAGCFIGTLKEFLSKVKESHSGTVHEAEYKAAITMIKAIFKARGR